ncbi:MAG TPA: hypothetical protein VH081_04895 [Solirubrobacteraceae bacterium]|nr:hypothetical protein [Solirubrobacteraceae bacterium]
MSVSVRVVDLHQALADIALFVSRPQGASMSKIRISIAFLGVTVALAAGVATSAAFADGCTEVEGDACIHIKKGGEEVLGTKIPVDFEVVSGTKVEFEIAGLAKITCEQIKGSGMLTSGPPPEGSAIKLEIAKCQVVGSTVCKVKEPVSAKSLDGSLFYGATDGVTLASEAGETGEVFSLTIEGTSCTIAGTLKFTGTQSCEEKNLEATLEIHTFLCTAAGSKLKAAAKEAKFATSTNVSLTGEYAGLGWGAGDDLF